MCFSCGLHYQIYTDSQTAIDGLKHCSLSTYSYSRLYYKTTNFELWAIIQKLILDKHLSVLPFKVKAHSNLYWNDFADSLANTAHTADEIWQLCMTLFSYTMT